MAVTAFATTTTMVERYGTVPITRLYKLLNIAAPHDPAPDITANTTLLKAVATANGIVDSYLRRRYDIAALSAPFDDTLIDIACRLAIGQLLKARPAMKDDDDEQDVREVMDYLRDLSRGVASIVDPIPAQAVEKKDWKKSKIGSDTATREDSPHASDQPWFRDV